MAGLLHQTAKKALVKSAPLELRRHASRPAIARLKAVPETPLVPRIVYEDDRHLVLNKPSNVALQGQHGSPARKRWDGLLDTLKARPESPTLHAVHRLDKVRSHGSSSPLLGHPTSLSQATTGALLLAKSPAIAARLVQQLQRHEIKKTYLAVVHGQLRPGFEGDIRNRLRMDLERVRVCGDDEGVEAHTQWQCISVSSRFSLLRLSPTSGRKHQLRVHCADVLKAPVVGDFKLAPNAPHADALNELMIPLDQVLLHSTSLSFYAWSKETGRRSTITATAPPSAEFQRFCKSHGLRIPEEMLA
ncbi:pseudouridine synthase [Rhodotorula toruloides]